MKEAGKFTSLGQQSKEITLSAEKVYSVSSKKVRRENSLDPQKF